jgi:serine protease Do
MRFLIVTLCFAAATTAFAQSGERAHSTTFRQIANRGYLGVGVVELTDDRAKALNLKDNQGLEVKLVDPSSPAAKAGIKVNDVILEVNSSAIADNTQFQSLIGGMTPGTKVSLAVWRNGAKQTLSATLDARPVLFIGPDMQAMPIPPMPPVPPNGVNILPIPSDAPFVGFEGEALGPQLAEYFGVKEGVLVRSVNANTPASHAGLKAGDVVTKVNGTPVVSPREITGLVRMSGRRTVTFTVVRNKKELTLNVEIAETDSVGPGSQPAAGLLPGVFIHR